MNKDKTDIGNICREAFKNFEVSPPDDVLENVIKQVHPPKSNISGRTSIIIAALALISVFVVLYFLQDFGTAEENKNTQSKEPAQSVMPIKEDVQKIPQEQAAAKTVSPNLKVKEAQNTHLKQKKSENQKDNISQSSTNNSGEAAKQTSQTPLETQPEIIQAYPEADEIIIRGAEPETIRPKPIEVKETPPALANTPIELKEDSLSGEERNITRLEMNFDQYICRGEEAMIIVPEGSTYLWNTGETSSSIVVKPDETTTYSVIINGFTGESVEAFATVYVMECAVQIPNAFSPNGDGLNDYFRVRGNGLEDFRMQIISRWGQLIYEGSDPGEGWDGKVSGSPGPIGVYIYKVSFMDPAGKPHQLYGTVTLIR